jgi:hypothetical protein
MTLVDYFPAQSELLASTTSRTRVRIQHAIAAAERLQAGCPCEVLAAGSAAAPPHCIEPGQVTITSSLADSNGDDYVTTALTLTAVPTATAGGSRLRTSGAPLPPVPRLHSTTAARLFRGLLGMWPGTSPAYQFRSPAADYHVLDVANTAAFMPDDMVATFAGLPARSESHLYCFPDARRMAVGAFTPSPDPTPIGISTPSLDPTPAVGVSTSLLDATPEVSPAADYIVSPTASPASLPPPPSQTPSQTPTRASVPATIPYFTRVLVLRMHGRAMFAHLVTEEVVAAVGIAHQYLQDDVPRFVGNDTQGEAQASSVTDVFYRTYIGVYGCGLAQQIISFMRAIFGDRILPRIVSAPLLAGEFIMPEAVGSRTHSPTARIASRVVRRKMQLAQRPRITCNITGAFAPQSGELGTGIAGACHVPAANTLAGQEQWRESVAIANTGRRSVAALVGHEQLPAGAAANRTLTVLLVLRGRHRRIHNMPELYSGLRALQDRMWEEYGIETDVLMHSDLQPELLDPVASLRLFHQADVIISAHGECSCAGVLVRSTRGVVRATMRARVHTVSRCANTLMCAHARCSGETASLAASAHHCFVSIAASCSTIPCLRAGAGLVYIIASRPGTHLFEFTLDPDVQGGKGNMVDWFGHMGGAMGLHVTILPSQWHVDADHPVSTEMRDVGVDVPLLLQRLQQVYLVHDYGPRE